ncbi:Uu.00g101740.m01.CDS01 [Anthostomella pinea]|uniref:Uu.00g101740.m01.CDS01 n=1 Tax=Anthostomella pinea TaxID=933095 RepID=A0AAI8VD36_9PEZI|nr:Uu.00g101740.m01.CDS01 [Anthostomella pinea]
MKKLDREDLLEDNGFHQRFHDQQYTWCPAVFDVGMGQHFSEQVLPLHRKDKIEPYRDDYVRSQNNSTLWEVQIPRELVSPTLQGKLAPATIHEKHCRCVLKQYPASKYNLFSNDRRMAEALGMKDPSQITDGVVRHFGWYQAVDRSDDNNLEEVFVIVMEWGEMDFYTVIRTMSPPTTPAEVKRFWEKMCHVACALNGVHQLIRRDLTYNMCHGDVKLENILLVDGSFKLADSAEARIEVSTSSNNPHTSMPGGTKTHASPEKSRQMSSDGASDLRVPLNSDVWSLGCVFSIAATFVILGAQGVLQYDRLRLVTHHIRTESESDVFHDGNEVLPEILAWHDYLCALRRENDTLTPAILKLVSTHMLVGDSNVRAEAAGVIKLMTETIGKFIDKCPGLPFEINVFLEALEQQVRSERHLQLGSDGDTDLEEDPGDSSALQSSNLQRPFKSTQRLLSQPILPTIQRKELDQYESTAVPSSDRHLKRPTAALSAPDSLFLTENGRVSDMWKVRKELEALQKDTSLSGLRSKLGFLGHRKGKSVKEEKQRSKRDELEDFYNGRDIVFLVDNGPTMLTYWKLATNLVEVLAWCALGCDDDGMELYSTNPESKAQVKQKKNQEVGQFVKAMNSGKPSLNAPQPKTTIIPALRRILTSYEEASQPKNKTIIVLTDGVWEDIIEDGVDTERLSQSRPMTFQFIRFDHDPVGMERLRRLDDDMIAQGYPDLVDTEPAAGDIYKMFLGSLSDAMDQSKNIVNSASRYSYHPSLSPGSPSHPLSPIHSFSATLGTTANE